MTSNLPQAFLAKLQAVQGKRARIVVDHILEHGYITTEQLEEIYKYKHPPRAVKDVRDQGIPIETYRVTSSEGKRIAAYRFGDPSQVREGRIGGRKAFSRKFKESLYREYGGKCAICGGSFALRDLQVDHRIPYEISGDNSESGDSSTPFMMVCGSCNRAKSWSCEHCPNWANKSMDVCVKCYWANPIDYEHVAMNNVKRLDIRWEGDDEMDLYAEVERSAKSRKLTISEYIKNVLRNLLASIVKLF